MNTDKGDNVISFKSFDETALMANRDETGYELRKRIVSEFRRRAWKRPGRKPSGRVTLYMIDCLIREGREEEARALEPYVTTVSKKRGHRFASENKTASHERYKARKEREREARFLLTGETDRARAERNEEVRFVVSANIMHKASERAHEMGLSLGELCRVYVARLAGAEIDVTVRQPNLPGIQF